MPTVMSSRMVTAPRYLPITISQAASGRVISNSMVRVPYSAENRRIETMGSKVTSRMLMLRKVSVIVAVPVRKTL